MIWCLLGLGIACTGLTVFSFRRSMDYRATEAWIGVGFVSLLAAILLIVFGAIVLGGRSVGRTTCRHFSAQTGYPTKFAILNWADTGTCLARTPDGHWTKNTNIIVNVPPRR